MLRFPHPVERGWSMMELLVQKYNYFLILQNLFVFKVFYPLF